MVKEKGTWELGPPIVSSNGLNHLNLFIKNLLYKNKSQINITSTPINIYAKEGTENNYKNIVKRGLYKHIFNDSLSLLLKSFEKLFLYDFLENKVYYIIILYYSLLLVSSSCIKIEDCIGKNRIFSKILHEKIGFSLKNQRWFSNTITPGGI